MASAGRSSRAGTELERGQELVAACCCCPCCCAVLCCAVLCCAVLLCCCAALLLLLPLLLGGPPLLNSYLLIYNHSARWRSRIAFGPRARPMAAARRALCACLCWCGLPLRCAGLVCAALPLSAVCVRAVCLPEWAARKGKRRSCPQHGTAAPDQTPRSAPPGHDSPSGPGCVPILHAYNITLPQLVCAPHAHARTYKYIT